MVQGRARVTQHEEDMLQIKDASLSWQFGKIINIYYQGSSMPALVLGLKEFTANALLLNRQQNLVGLPLDFD